MKVIKNIIKGAVYNGHAVKIFSVWELRDGQEYFSGHYTAPAKVADKNLLAYYHEKIENTAMADFEDVALVYLS